MDFPPRRPPAERPKVSLDIEFAPLREPRDRDEPPQGAGGEDGPRSARSETLARIGWALPWIVAIVAAIAVGGLLFAAAMAAFACVGLEELFRMGRDARPFEIVAFGVAVALVIAAYWGSQFQIVIVGAAAFPAMFVAAAARDDRAGVTTSLAFTTLGIGWIAIPFAHAVLLRQLPLHGGALLVDVLVGTFLTDTFAYFGGRLFGAHKLSPRISPNKTLEGLVIGIAGGTLAFWFAGLYQDWLTGIDALAIGFCVAIIAPVGDLFESMIKRDLQVKDTGRIFGPHGGVLDRLDAVMFTVVVGYYLAVAFVY
jgi:phosphatidate cytidylyltransferase